MKCYFYDECKNEGKHWYSVTTNDGYGFGGYGGTYVDDEIVCEDCDKLIKGSNWEKKKDWC